MGSNVAGFGFGIPGSRPSASRSSWHVAQGHAARSQGKLQALECPSRQSISMPVPPLLSMRTFAGEMASPVSFGGALSARFIWS